MQCPHCLNHFHEVWVPASLDVSGNTANDADGSYFCRWAKCPACNRITILLFGGSGQARWQQMVRPRNVSRTPLPAEVPAEFSADYREACDVLAVSPKASAALSRRCLQHLLHEHFKIKKHNLDKEIEEVQTKLPNEIAEMLHSVRVIGNFAAHPTKSTNTGEILDVEPHEAEWQLDTLEALFDYCFVQPASIKKRKDAINAKLIAAGKQPLP